MEQLWSVLLDLVQAAAGFFAALDSTDTVTGAVRLAVFTASIGLIGWIGKQLHAWISAVLKRRRERRAAYVIFYTAVMIRLKNTKAHFSKKDMENYLLTVRSGGRKFKSYVVQGEETGDYAAIEPYLPDMSTELRFLVKSLTAYDQLFDAMYMKIGTDEFGNLSQTRKIAVVKQLYETADQVIDIAERVTKEMCKIRHIRKSRPR